MSPKVTAEQRAHAHANAAQVKVLTEHLCRADVTWLDDSAGSFLMEGTSEVASIEDPVPEPRDLVANVISPSKEGVLQPMED